VATTFTKADKSGEPRLVDGNGNTYEIPKIEVSLRGFVNKISYTNSYTFGSSIPLNKKDIDIKETFTGNLELDPYNSIGYFPNGSFELITVIIEENPISTDEAGYDYFEVFVSGESPPDEFGQFRIPSLMQIKIKLGEHSFSSIKEKLIGNDTISNKRISLGLNLDKNGIYENFIAYMSGDHTSSDVIGPYYRFLISKNHVSNSEELPDNFKSFMDDDNRYVSIKCKKPFDLKVISQSDLLSHPPL